MSTQDPCTQTLKRLGGLQLHLRVCADEPPEYGGPARDGLWLSAEQLLSPEQEPLASLMARFAATGSSANRRVASAALLLRFGWTAGFGIAAYLAGEPVPRLDDYAVLFAPSSLLHTLWIRGVTLQSSAYLWGDVGESGAGLPPVQDENSGRRHQLFTSLWQQFEPIVAAQHRWSGFSRHALWSMVTSGWAALFGSLARQLGDASWGIAEARGIFALHPELARAAPELYEVRVADAACTCQRRAACCLYFKCPGRSFCASCPLLPHSERLERNRQWVGAQRPIVSA